MTNLVQLDNSTFEDFLNTHPESVLVAFKAGWCTPCKFLTPILETLAHEGATIAVVDIDDAQTLAQQEGIMSLPTTICYKRGEESGRIVGLTSKARLVSLL